MNKIVAAAGAAAACLVSLNASALAVYLSPASSTVDVAQGTTTLELFMDFTGTTSQGGGIVLDISGPLSFASFTPSAYFGSLDTVQVVSQCPGYVAGNPATYCNPDTYDFTGYGTADKPASAEWEVHFGAFAGITGANKIGDITLDLTGVGLGTLALSASGELDFGPFVDLLGDPLEVDFIGAEVNAVPLPATAWLLPTAVGIAGVWRRRRR